MCYYAIMDVRDGRIHVTSTSKMIIDTIKTAYEDFWNYYTVVKVQI